MTNSCPSCAQPAEGRFCSHCGTALEGATCADCGNSLPSGARFCNQCGTPTRAAQPPAPAPAAARARPKLPWVVAGVAVVALVAVAVAPRLRDEPSAAAPSAEGGAAGGAMPSGAELAAMDPREAADRLFNRVMTAVSAGDSAQAQMFLPMALMAYDRVPELDLDGRYHVAVLHLANGDPGAARAEADRILAVEPDHLFGLYTAAEAERARGNETGARELFQRFLQSYDAQVGRDLTEYRDHARALPLHRDDARRFVGEG